MPKKIFLLLTVAVAALLHWPELHYQQIFSAGDIGRDLYTFEQVLHGKLVYKDIWWVYGPLMPYFYGLFYLAFGFKITSILLGKFLLNILCAVFFYLAASRMMSSSLAFLAAWFFTQNQQDFFFTHNHIGALALILAVFWLLLSYMDKRKISLGLGAVGISFIIGLIKINFGLTALIVTLVSVPLIDLFLPVSGSKPWDQKKKNFYFSGLCLVPLLWIAIYAALLWGLPLYEIRQCFPYLGDDQPYHHTIFETIPYFLMQHWLTFYHHWLNLIQVWGHLPPVMTALTVIKIALSTLAFASHLIIHGAMIAGFVLTFLSKFDNKQKRFWIIQGVLWSFFVLNLHEFLVSGIWYRTYWSQPFLLFFNFYMIQTALSFLPRWVGPTVKSYWIVFLGLLGFVSFVSTQSAKNPAQFLNMPRGQIYIGNTRPWVDTVNTVTDFLNRNLQKDELFFALPYDCLYYYLTARTSPTRQLIFFEHIKITPGQELSIIRELENKKVHYVVMSNRIITSEAGMGIFGKTYCPMIYQYIMQNFTPTYRYGGNWQAEPTNTDNHGIIIFKRKTRL